ESLRESGEAMSTRRSERQPKGWRRGALQRFSKRLRRWRGGKCQHGATCLTPHSLNPPGKRNASRIRYKSITAKEDFVQRFKTESKHVKGAPECMIISRFMHDITNHELIKRLHDNIPKSVDENTSNQARKKTLPAWKQQEVGRKQNFDRK
nr:reverse transcriptase domain-containing protein [Tanacetum cinerariifolium]